MKCNQVEDVIAHTQSIHWYNLSFCLPPNRTRPSKGSLMRKFSENHFRLKCVYGRCLYDGETKKEQLEWRWKMFIFSFHFIQNVVTSICHNNIVVIVVEWIRRCAIKWTSILCVWCCHSTGVWWVFI
jgi:hypothetical protein